jgi:hypothetical protein
MVNYQPISFVNPIAKKVDCAYESYQIRLNARIIETFGGTSLQDFGLGDSAVN